MDKTKFLNKCSGQLTAVLREIHVRSWSFSRPQGGNLTNNITQTKHTRTLAAVAPAEAGSNSSTVPVVWKRNCGDHVRPCPGRAYWAVFFYYFRRPERFFHQIGAYPLTKLFVKRPPSMPSLCAGSPSCLLVFIKKTHEQLQIKNSIVFKKKL